MQENYIAILKERAKKSRVYQKYQLTGLLLSQILEDEKHKSLYIKLARENNQQKLLELAKGVAERRNVKNKGAYFMKMFYLMKNKGIKTNADFHKYRRKAKNNAKRTKNNNGK